MNKFGLLLAIMVIGLIQTVQSEAQDTDSNSTSLESRIASTYQAKYEEHMQGIYKMYHPWGGKATAITVTSANITKWKNDISTGLGVDVQQFDVNYTILWTSLLHPHGTGHTDAKSTYQVIEGQVKNVGNRILATNGKHTVDNEGSDLTSAAKVLLFMK